MKHLGCCLILEWCLVLKCIQQHSLACCDICQFIMASLEVLLDPLMSKKGIGNLEVVTQASMKLCCFLIDNKQE